MEISQFALDVRALVWSQDTTELNKYFDEIDLQDINLLDAIYILRVSSVYKLQVPRWHDLYQVAVSLCNIEGLDPAKELFGLDRY